MEEMARAQKGRTHFQCPKDGCPESFVISDLYQKINADVYGEMLMAMDKTVETIETLFCLLSVNLLLEE